MSVLPILHWPHPRLSQIARPVGAVTDDVRSLAADMLETMYAAPGRGLAAPQVGVLSRIFVMDATWKDGEREPMVCIDPEILGASNETVEFDEGCLSIPGVIMAITRLEAVRMAWTALDGARVIAALDGIAARVAQHELDHLDGIVTFDRLPDAARAVALDDYAAVGA